jgi:hypothetical protein
MRIALIILALLASAPAMGQSALHGDTSNYSPGPRNVDPGPWRKDTLPQAYYDEIDLGRIASTCQRGGGQPYRCYMCSSGTNAMTMTEHECSADEALRQARARR